MDFRSFHGIIQWTGKKKYTHGHAVNGLKEFIKGKGLDKKVKIHGSVEYTDVPDYIAMCDIGTLHLQDFLYYGG